MGRRHGPRTGKTPQVINGTNGNDNIRNEHSWEVYAHGGNDIVVNHKLGSKIYAGAGDDRIENHVYSSKIYGGDGNDTIN